MPCGSVRSPTENTRDSGPIAEADARARSSSSATPVAPAAVSTAGESGAGPAPHGANRSPCGSTAPEKSRWCACTSVLGAPSGCPETTNTSSEAASAPWSTNAARAAGSSWSVTVMPAHQAPSSSGTSCQLGVVRTATTPPDVPPSSSQSSPATFADQLASEAVDSSVRPAPYQVIRGLPESPASNGPSRVVVTPAGRGRVTGGPSGRGEFLGTAGSVDAWRPQLTHGTDEAASATRAAAGAGCAAAGAG